MPADFRISQAALVIIAMALSIQSLLLIAGAWFLVGAWNKAREQLDCRLELLQARVDVMADATQHMVGTIDRCARQTSLILDHGERLASGLATVVTGPKIWLLTGAVSTVVSRWRSKGKGGPRAGQSETASPFR